MSPPVDFDLLGLLSRVSEAWELGIDGLYWKYRSYIKKYKKQTKLIPGVQKSIFGGPSEIVVGSVVSKSRRWREERANARHEREVTVYGNSLRSANNPLCNHLRNR